MAGPDPLKVIKVEGWKREDLFDRTGLTWELSLLSWGRFATCLCGRGPAEPSGTGVE